MGTLLRLFENYCAPVTKKYCALKQQEILNLTIIFFFRFLQLRNIRGTYSKYFKKHIYGTGTSSPSLRSTTACSFAGILCTFNICNISLHLE